MALSVLVNCQTLLGEGPVWTAADQSFSWLDIYRSELHRSIGGDVTSLQLERAVTAFAPWPRGNGFICATDAGIERLSLETGQLSLVIPIETDKPGNRTNDGKCDPQGRFWFGTMDNAEEDDAAGSLYSVDLDGTVMCHLTQIGISNTFAWSPDGKAFYFADSMAQTIWRFPWDAATGRLGERDVFVSLKGTDRYPDGSTIDAEGYLWNAQWNGWRVTRYAPDGREDRVVEMPVACPTSCCFAGPNQGQLYITSARKGQSEEALSSQPAAGAVFVLEDPGAVGIPETDCGVQFPLRNSVG